MTEKELFEKFQKNEMSKGYIPKESCLFFITEAIRNNFTILGIEGLRIKNDKIIPNLDEIFDFTIDKDINHIHHTAYPAKEYRKVPLAPSDKAQSME